MSTQLGQIAKKAELDRQGRFTSSAHLLTPAFLKETWRTINRNGAGGVDGESTDQSASELEQRVQEICVQLKAGTYRAPPVYGLRYPKDQASAARDRWEFPLSPTGCFNGRSHAFSRRCSKPTSATSALDFDLVETLITRCSPFRGRS